MRWLDNFWQDVRHGARLLIKNPGFTAIAVLSIAFGTGANVAMFSATDAMLLRPLPVAKADGLYTVGMKLSLGPLHDTQMSYADFVDVRARSRTMQSWVAYDTGKSSIGVDAGSPRTRLVTAVSGNFFGDLGLPMELGRGIVPAEDQVPGRDAVVVITYGLWQHSFGGDPHVVGRRMFVGNHPFTIIGVTAESYTGMYPSRLIPDESFVPLAMSREVFRQELANDRLTDRDQRSATVKARLRPGVSLGEARAEMDSIGRDLQRVYPQTNRGQDIVVQTELQARITQGQLEAGVLVILNILALAVLCVACANVAGLLTSRAPLRQRELALRLAIGASRARLVAQLLTESVLLGLLGGVGGVLVGRAGIRVIQQIALPTDVIGAPAFVLNQRALVFSIAVAVISALFFGLGPAITTTRIDLSQSIRGTEPAWLRRWRPGGRSTLTAIQVALSLTILSIAGVTYQTFRGTFGVGPGFRTAQMGMVSVDAAQVGYDGPKATMLFDQIVTSTRQIPGVTGAAATSAMPLAHLDLMPVVFEHGELSAPENRLTLFANVVTEGYFQTMDIPVIEGRTFTRNDRAETPAVAVVNQAMARHFWSGSHAVGQRIRLVDERGPMVEIVGVVGTTTYLYPSEKPQDMLYLTFRQQPRGDMTVLAQTAGRSATPLPAMQRLVHSLDASVPVYDVHTVEAFYRGHATGLGAVIMTMIASIGFMGLTITLVGLYGLVSYAVNRRTREIGIRIAIGATSTRILRMLLRQGLAPAWVGMGIGVVLSLLSARMLVSFVESSAVFSPLVVAAILPVLAAVTLLAAFVPARRAAKTDPTVALRAE